MTMILGSVTQLTHNTPHVGGKLVAKGAPEAESVIPDFTIRCPSCGWAMVRRHHETETRCLCINPCCAYYNKIGTMPRLRMTLVGDDLGELLDTPDAP